MVKARGINPRSLAFPDLLTLQVEGEAAEFLKSVAVTILRITSKDSKQMGQTLRILVHSTRSVPVESTRVVE